MAIKRHVAQASKFIRFSVSMWVYEELKQIAEFDDVHGRSARDVLGLVESGIISVKSVQAGQEHAENIDMGEAETLTLAESDEYDYIITDDVKALPYIKSKAKVKVLTSVFVIRLLYDLNILTHQR
ncbi:MAG: hypothetical protein Q8O41_09210, partial [Candidatus Methanoperedens sp.]|nr:hypothetical protein [Candidatus Methanoperedens sp.]